MCTVHEAGGNESKDEKVIQTSQHVNKPYQMGLSPGGVGHGPRDQFCPITSLQMAD